MSEAQPDVTDNTQPASEPAQVPVSQPAAPAANWRASLPPDLASNPTLERFEDVAALAKEHVNVQKLIGADKIARPQEDWTPEQFDDFYTKLGRPASVDDYDMDSITRPEDLPWDDEFQTHMLGVLHKAGITQDQIGVLFPAYIEFMSGQYKSAMGEVEQTRNSSLTDLQNEWGKSFKGNVDLAQRAFKAATGENFESVSELVMADGGKLGDHPAIIRAFAQLGGQLNDHGLVGGKSTRSTFSPQEAKGELDRLMGDEHFRGALMNAQHPEHSAAVQRRADLYEQIVPQEE